MDYTQPMDILIGNRPLCKGILGGMASDLLWNETHANAADAINSTRPCLKPWT